MSLLLFMLGLMVFVGLLAGSYPATFMARLNAIAAIRGGKVKGGSPLLRKGLVIFQFAITIALIMGVIVVDQQIDFIRKKDPGFERELIVNYWASPPMQERLDVVKNELLSNPNIVAATTSSRIPTTRLGDALSAKTFQKEAGEVVDFRLPFIRIDEDFLGVYDIPLVAGEGFAVPLSDSTQRFLLNTTAVKKLGWDSPEDAIGQKIEYGWYTGFVSGVVEDFHFESMHSAIQPMIMMNDVRNKRQMSVKITGSNIPSTIAFMETQFKRYNPDRNFNSSFVDELFDGQYRGEQRLSDISKVFSMVAIVIACMGLLGLVSYSMQRRAKEISVRKVLGASVQNILVMVNRGYALTMLIAFAIAAPAAYYFLSDWLQTFAYHINLGAGLFVLAGVLAGVLAILTISSQGIKFATANPVKFLRNE